MSAPSRHSSVIYGFPVECADFEKRNPEFVHRAGNLEKAVDAAFHRVYDNTKLCERTVYFLGRLAAEEFFEILLLCQHGYGIGAEKLLRGMYERAVTADYLRKHPDEAESFKNYGKVADYKLLESWRACGAGHRVSQEQADIVARDYELIKKDFEVTACKKCGTKRVNHGWNKKDFVSMARETALWPLLAIAYHQPTNQLHTTIGSIYARLDPKAVADNEGLMFDSNAQREKADSTLHSAHVILLNVLNTQRECFEIPELESLLQICIEDMTVIYKDRKAE
jgi:Family of unknown function (DUF5677)